MIVRGVRTFTHRWWCFIYVFTVTVLIIIIYAHTFFTTV